MDHGCLALLWLAVFLRFELIFNDPICLWVEWTGGSVFEFPLFRECVNSLDEYCGSLSLITSHGLP